MSQKVRVETLANGLTVIVEPIAGVESVAYELVIPGGIVTDDPKYQGSSLLLAELSARGAGEFDSRALSDAFDRRGIRHSENGGHDRFVYRGALLCDHLAEALKLISLVLREPRLPAEEIDPIKSLLLQDIAALLDNPARRVMTELSTRYYPTPWGRPSHGTEDGIKSCNPRQQKAEWELRYGAKRSILSVAGKCEHEEVLKVVDRCFGTWAGEAAELPKFGPMPAHAYSHVSVESAQLQIALAFPGAPFGHPKFYAAKVASGILSGGMFGRLFTEVRETRGLVYNVYARHSATREYGTVSAYAGTTPERGQETLEVMLQELRSVKGTVREAELKRAKANLKSALVIGEESSSSRASSNASDWWLDKRVRSLDEILQSIDAVSLGDIDGYFEEFPLSSFMLVTLGAKDLKV
jgi:predicted Zn-dependent peptidase